MSFNRYDRYVDRHARTFIERLQALCRMPSVAARGTGMRAMADAVEQMLRRVGAGTKTFKLGGGYPIVFGECGSGSHSVLLYGHYDVQPVGHLTNWTYGPFSAHIADGKLFARGASNSKGDFVARVSAIEAYQKSFGKLPLCFRYLIEGEEGMGSPSLYRLAGDEPSLFEADGCIWDEGYIDPNGRLLISLGFKGITFLELRTYGARTELHSKWGTIVPNPAWRLIQALSTIVSPKGVITIDRFSSHIAPLSPEDAAALDGIELDETILKQEFRVVKWIRGLKGRALVREHIFGPTCTVCGILAGHIEAGPKTVLPSTAMARLDFRLVPDLTPQLVKDLLREHLDVRGFADIEITELGRAYLAKSSANTAVARAAIEAAREVYVSPPIVFPLEPSSGPVGAICGTSEPCLPLVSFGTSYAGSNPHGPDENIRLDDFLLNVKYFGRVIHRLGQLLGRDTKTEKKDAVQIA